MNKLQLVDQIYLKFIIHQKLEAAMQRKRYSGIVIGGNGTPIASAQFHHAGKKIGKTDRNGRFTFSLAADGSRIPVTFLATGYLPNTRLFDSRSPGNGNTIVIWPIANRVTFDATLGLDIDFSGSKICIKPGTLLSSDGSPLGRGATLEFTLLDVTNAQQRPAITGDFKGLMSDRSVVQLNSFGVFELNILDRRGRAAILKEGSSIDIAIAVPRRLAPKAPAAIGYFDFDPGTGNWVEVGSFEWSAKMLTYNGRVERFGGAQNLDDPTKVTCVTIRVMNGYFQTPFANASVSINLSQSISYGTSDTNGYVCLLVERNMPFAVEATVVDGTTTYKNPWPVNFMAPNIQSGAGDCGDPVKCPYLGNVDLSALTTLP